MDLAGLRQISASVNKTQVQDMLVFLRKAQPFTLVLQANVTGGTKFFLDSVLTPDCVVVTPSRTPKEVINYSTVEGVEDLHVTFKGQRVRCRYLELLQALQHCKFQKIFLNHVVGHPLEFLRGLFALDKRFISVSHDFTWILDTVAPAASDLHKNLTRNTLLQPFHSQIEMKFQTVATRDCFRHFARFKSEQVLPMPDYHASKDVKLEVSEDLVLASVGDISWIKGSDAMVNVSKVHIGQGDTFELGFKYIQLGDWRLGQLDMAFEISHYAGRQRLLLLPDGEMRTGLSNQTLWQVRRCGLSVTQSTRVAVGHDFIQMGEWRMGVDDGRLAFSHKSNRSSAIFFGKTPGRSTLWDRKISPKSSTVRAGMNFFKVGSWSLLHDAKRLTVVNGATVVQSFFADGKVSKVPAKGNVPVGGNRLPANVKMVVFGMPVSCLPPGDNFISKRFQGVDAFNLLLREYKPNVLLVAPVVFETYSYTLTLSMLTKLPIIVRTPPDGLETAIAYRLRDYPNVAFHDFGDATSVVDRARSMKARWMTEVSPHFLVPWEWSDLLAAG